MKLEDYVDALSRCSQCNFCQAVCPVFKIKITENFLARNRLNLIREVLVEKNMKATPRFTEILDTCLLCTNCTQNCSSNVPVDEIIIAARSKLSEEDKGISLIKKKVFSGLMKNNNLMNVIARLGESAQKFGLARNVPEFSSDTFFSMIKKRQKPEKDPKFCVAYYAGCGTNLFYPETGMALINILDKLNIEVIVPEGLSCCGLPLLIEGDIQAATEALMQNIEILSSIECDKILMECTSCMMMFAKKGIKLLGDDSTKSKLNKITEKLVDGLKFIHEYCAIELKNNTDSTFTYHRPCHCDKSSSSYNTAEIVRSITGATYVELEESDLCCGAGGTYYLKDDKLSRAIRELKIKDIKQTKAKTVLTECPMCRYYINQSIEEVEVIHPLEFVAKSVL